jgi:hypothetical protein
VDQSADGHHRHEDRDPRQGADGDAATLPTPTAVTREEIANGPQSYLLVVAELHPLVGLVGMFQA